MKVAYASEFVLVIVCNIFAVIIYCYRSGWDIKLFLG